MLAACVWHRRADPAPLMAINCLPADWQRRRDWPKQTCFVSLISTTQPWS